jgi:hypothetical protein
MNFRIFIRKMEFRKKENIWTVHADPAHNYSARGPASRDAWWPKGWMVLGLAGQVRCQSGLASPVATLRCARAQSSRPRPTGWHSGRWWPGGLGAWRWPSRAQGIQGEGARQGESRVSSPRRSSSGEVVEEEGPSWVRERQGRKMIRLLWSWVKGNRSSLLFLFYQ